MPDIKALIRYINERRVEEGGGSGYSFVRELPPNIRDTFFAVSCLKMLNIATQDREIVDFISSYDYFSLNSAYYTMKCLKMTGAEVTYHDGWLRWQYDGKKQVKPTFIPSNPLIGNFKLDLYGEYGSSIFSSPLSAVLKRIELGESDIDQGLVNSVIAVLKLSNQLDIMTIFMAIEILNAISAKGSLAQLPTQTMQQIKSYLKRCTTRKGYVANPTSSSISLESTYAGHRIAQYLGISEPQAICAFIDSLQNDNGGFRRTPFGGISTLESCYLALGIIADITLSSENKRLQRQEA